MRFSDWLWLMRVENKPPLPVEERPHPGHDPAGEPFRRAYAMFWNGGIDRYTEQWVWSGEHPEVSVAFRSGDRTFWKVHRHSP